MEPSRPATIMTTRTDKQKIKLQKTFTSQIRCPFFQKKMKISKVAPIKPKLNKIMCVSLEKTWD